MTGAPSSRIGVSRPRLDGERIVRGLATYAADIPVHHVLHARLVLSPYARARIAEIDGSAALEAPGAVAVLTAADLDAHLQVDPSASSRQLEPLARREVVFAGQPVAIVVAESAGEAEDAAELVTVLYEPLEPVLDVERAAEPDAPPARPGLGGDEDAGMAMHADVGSAGAEQGGPLPANVAGRHHQVEGDVETALAGCDAVVRGRFRTAWVYQGYLEPHAAIARVEPDGSVFVQASTQGTFYVRQQLSRLFGLPADRIRVAAAALGGAFGSKLLHAEPLVLGAALCVGRPVRLVMTRLEDMAAAQPAPATVVDLELGARASGELVAIRARILVDTGAYADWSVASMAPALLAGPYRWTAWDLESFGVLTNRCPAGPYRGPGGPQMAFAIESLLDELAARLDVDPLELRLRSAVRPGDPKVGGGTWPSVGAVECLEALRGHPLLERRGSLPPGEGIGVSFGAWPGAKMSASAVTRLDPDGGLTITTGAVDMTGSHSGFAAVAAEVLGIPAEQVRVAMADTAAAPLAPPTGGSVSSYSVALAVKRAAEDARAQLLEVAARELEIAAADLELVDGVIRPVGSPDRGVAVPAIAARLSGFGSGLPPVEGRGSAAPGEHAPSSAAHLAHVHVDAETGHVRVLGYTMAQDCGRALNPALVAGQMTGGAAQGVGWALLEELAHDEDGNLLTGSLLTYALPGAAELPNMETIIVEVPSSEGPFGARGVGEASLVGAPAAIANAVAAATGVRPRALPISPAALGAAIASQGDSC